MPVSESASDRTPSSRQSASEPSVLADQAVPTDQTVRQLFDRIAPVYDEFNQRLSFGLHTIWKQMTVDWSGVQPGDRCLDLCCGSGDIALLLARRVGSAGQVVGADFSTQQLAIARDRAQRQCPSLSIDWIEANAVDLPFDSHSFDGATVGYGLRNVTHIPRCLQELHRVLKPGAKAAILDFHRPENPWASTFQQWYLQNIVVPTADSFGLRSEYAYISPSLDRFPQGRAQMALAVQAGFSHAVHYPILGGMMGVLVATG
ncbi:MAG: bifunctional demethylmenaquinone methyltransferase/2-methoxy-6-polyprenyl-1,4-benzoquinol methylase UbiE [Cyanobacteria bacterium P01_C01_bin.73]